MPDPARVGSNYACMKEFAGIVSAQTIEGFLRSSYGQFAVHSTATPFVA